MLGGRLIQRARMGKGYLPLIQAQYVRAGMAVADAKGGVRHRARSRAARPESRTVYDLDVEDSHNFIANGICTHNSIYAFRGANVGNMADFEREFRVRNLIKLEQNYRSGGHILNAANALISNNQRRLGKDLWTDAGEGEPVRIYEAQTDGYEAAWMVEEDQEPDRRRLLARRDCDSVPVERAVARDRTCAVQCSDSVSRLRRA